MIFDKCHHLLTLSSFYIFSIFIFPVPTSCSHHYVPSSDYVDPYDMGSYSHGTKSNLLAKDRRGMGGSIIGKHGHENVVEKVTYIEINHQKIVNYADAQKPSPIPGVPDYVIPSKPVELEQNYSRTVKYFQRVIASLIYQMNLRGKQFGPREAITIDLQAEISYENYLVLNEFSLGDPENPETIQNLSSIDEIISNLLHIVHPPDSMGTGEYLKELLIFHLSNLLNFKVWLSLISLLSVAVIVITLCTKVVSLRSDPKLFIFYSFLLFLVLSCCWSFAERYETVKAENFARLRQYNGLPRDCEYNELGFIENIQYFFRVKVFRFPDQCEEYYKEELIDAFYLASPVEAISATFSKLIFHPMEYIGIRLGKFFGGIVSAVPFWLQPFLLILVFIFCFLACFRYKISSPFISIEPAFAPRLHQPQYQQLHHHQQEPGAGAVLEKPPREIVPLDRLDAWTSTDDLEDYIRIQEQRQEDQAEPSIADSGNPNLNYILSMVLGIGQLIFQFIRALLYEIPTNVPPPPPNEYDSDDEFWNQANNRPILQHMEEQIEINQHLAPEPEPSTSRARPAFSNSFNIPTFVSNSMDNNELPEGFDELLDLDFMEFEAGDDSGSDSSSPSKSSNCISKSKSSIDIKSSLIKDVELNPNVSHEHGKVDSDSTYASFCDLNDRQT